MCKTLNLPQAISSNYYSHAHIDDGDLGFAFIEYHDVNVGTSHAAD